MDGKEDEQMMTDDKEMKKAKKKTKYGRNFNRQLGRTI